MYFVQCGILLKEQNNIGYAAGKKKENVMQHHLYAIVNSKMYWPVRGFNYDTVQNPKRFTLLPQKTKKDSKSSQKIGWNKGMFSIFLEKWLKRVTK